MAALCDCVKELSKKWPEGKCCWWEIVDESLDHDFASLKDIYGSSASTDVFAHGFGTITYDWG